MVHDQAVPHTTRPGFATQIIAIQVDSALPRVGGAVHPPLSIHALAQQSFNCSDKTTRQESPDRTQIVLITRRDARGPPTGSSEAAKWKVWRDRSKPIAFNFLSEWRVAAACYHLFPCRRSATRTDATRTLADGKFCRNVWTTAMVPSKYAGSLAPIVPLSLDSTG